MTTARHDVLGLGNAIVDVITRADDAFLVEHDMRKGGMALIDEARAAQVYDAMGPAVEISGGSAANTIVGAAGFGAPPSSARSKTISSAPPSPTTSAPRASPSTRRQRPTVLRPVAATCW